MCVGAGAAMHRRGQFKFDRGTNKSVFQSLQESITEYFNETKWTNAVFSPNEKIECRFFLTVKEYADDRIKGDLQVQVSRPVYNSTYTTTLLNFKDTKIESSTTVRVTRLSLTTAAGTATSREY